MTRAQVLRLMERTEEALHDLDLAIKFGGNAIKKQAYAQKGIILKSQGNEQAQECFEMAAKLGNNAVKQEAIKGNPYAALCSQMLSEVMSKYQSNCSGKE